MGITTEELLLQQSIPNNFISRIEALEREFALYKNGAPAAGVVSDWAGDLGDIVAGNLIMGNGVPLGEGFTGLYQSAESFEWPIGSGQFWNFGGFNADEIEVGISATTGQILGAGGLLVIGKNAVQMNGINYGLQHAAEDSAPRYMRYGMTEYDGANTPHGQILYTGSAGANVIDNPGFEDGDFTSWTAVADTGGSWSVQSDIVYDGTYAAALDKGGTGGPATLTSDQVAVSGSTPYEIAFSTIRAVDGFSGGADYVNILWYDAASGGSLIKTDILYFQSLPNFWYNFNTTLVSPPAALGVKFKLELSVGGGGLFYFDDFSISAVSISTQIGFRPNPTIMGGPLEFLNLDASPTTPLTDYGAVYTKSDLLYFMDSAGLEYLLSLDNPNTNPVDVQTFSIVGSTTWNKPTGTKAVMVIAIGAGGGGGGGARANTATRRGGGGGGGGGNMSIRTFPASEVTTPQTVTAGTGGAGGNGATSGSSDGSPGTNGNPSSFGTLLVAGAGKGGAGGTRTASSATPGGQGGTAANGTNQTAADGQYGGGGIGGNGGGTAHETGGAAEFGGGGGGNGPFSATAGLGDGGGSVYGGGGGGGGGGSNNNSNNASDVGDGGGVRMYAVGGAVSGTAGTTGATPTAGNAGADYLVALNGGEGGGGGGAGISGTNNVAGAAGGRGGKFGGGGGGGGAGTGTGNGGNGGNGAEGYVVVISW